MGAIPGFWEPSESADRTDKLDQLATEMLAALLKSHPLKTPPSIEWRNYRTTAGTATFETNVISLSRLLITDEHRLRVTLLHEYAHLVAFERHGHRAKGHGPAWRNAMRELGLEPNVHHTFDCKRNESRRLVIYRCRKCALEFERKRRLPRRRQYVHAGCGGLLVLADILERRAPSKRETLRTSHS